jgi:hypothetical protein
MNLEKELREAYLKKLKEIGEKGYSHLCYQREQIKKEMISKFLGTGCDNNLLGLIDCYDLIIFDFLDSEMLRGSRPLGWPNYFEAEIMNRLAINHIPPE